MNKKIDAITEYTHIQGGHCESAGVSSLVTNYGFNLSESMAFGISSCIMFTYFPFVKVWGMPLISYRMTPRSIITGVQKSLGIKFFTKTYNDELQAMNELDGLLDQKKPVGLVVSASFLAYFCPEFNMPFNGHTTILYGREGDEYLVSDPIFEYTTRATRDQVRKARFAKGLNAPKGFIFYPEYFPEAIDYRKAIRKAIKKTMTMMLQPMFPYVGIRAIYTMARRIKRLNGYSDQKYVKKYLGNIITFQEEVGTGGGGFRFIYAAFLKEASELLNMRELLEASRKMVQVGDLWRQAALSCAKALKGKQETIDTRPIADGFRKCAKAEKEVYLMLKKIKW
jgi:hypothetical protein